MNKCFSNWAGNHSHAQELEIALPHKRSGRFQPMVGEAGEPETQL
uniref:Uncharacterized protein n=1 Tax=Arundo donax TaxID=35708 RepID=A0A0A8ZPD8_ARUDO